MKNILETECVTKEFRGHPAVCGVSLQVPECCVYGLLGPNGAGKSTILKMLTGILRPTSGKVLFDGHPWSRKDAADIREPVGLGELKSPGIHAWHTRQEDPGCVGTGGSF